MADVRAALEEIVGAANVLAGDAIGDDYAHDEALTATQQLPAFVAKPASTEDVAGIVAVAREHKVPITARGSGTGLSGACIPRSDGILISFERMNAILEIDTQNHVAVVQPGVTLDELDRATAEHGFVYPVYPGENSASLGGNVATNAGGLRAVKYGVTRHQVLGLTAVLGTGEVIRTGGRFVKATTGYDLTQIIIGSEGTLALATEATLKLYPRAEFATTLLAPFATLDQITAIVPTIIASGVAPLIVEYIDFVSMNGILTNAGLDLGIPQTIKETALAYLVVVLEDRRSDRLEENVEEMATLISEQGALDIYVLPPQAGVQLIHARERAFWAAKAAGANDIIDMVVPRAAIPQYMATVNELAKASESFLTGCGHVGDGNVHLSVFQPDEAKRHALIRAIFEAGMALGGAISGEHGIGTEKKPYYNELEQPSKLDLMRRIKAAFDPDGILNPGKIFDERVG
jgi:glycolate dehydrogenase FAD-linked subunit